jgi:hypothetical protein
LWGYTHETQEENLSYFSLNNLEKTMIDVKVCTILNDGTVF